MKVRWREHEAVLVSMIATILIVGYSYQMIRLSPLAIQDIYAVSFGKANINFNYYSRVLLPQLGSVLVLWISYFWINRIIMTRIASPKRNVVTFLTLLIHALVVSYIIGPVINFASYYINPFYQGKNYTPLSFGYHPQPVLNIFGGWGIALFIVLIVVVYTTIRELIIDFYNKMGSRKAYAIEVNNQITFFLVPFFTLPVFTSVFDLVTNPFYYRLYYALLLAVAAVFNTNKFWLFPLKENRSFFNWQSIGPIMFCSFVFTLIFSIALGPDWSLPLVLAGWVLQLGITTPASWLDYQQDKDKLLKLRGLRKSLSKSNADLQLLRMQINPHFLFNILNTLYGTALIENAKNTAAGIQKLGDMMRFMLHENTVDEITMSREIEYLENYIALQKLRTQLSPDIIIEDHITADSCHHKIAPMLLIPLVENAFKHGINLAGKSWIKIRLCCAEKELTFEVRNGVHALNEDDPEHGSSGIGLKNVEERLQLLYADKHRFTYGSQENEFIARLTIQF